MFKHLPIAIQKGKPTYAYFTVRSSDPRGKLIDKHYLSKDQRNIEYHRQRENPHYYKNVVRMHTISTTQLETSDA